jgi:hypothetical protein
MAEEGGQMARSRVQTEAVAAAFRTISAAGRVDGPSLQTLVEACCDGDARTASQASTYLALLTPECAELRDAILRMAGNDRWRVRERAMHTVNVRAPGEFGRHLARIGLADPNWRVRRRAADLVFSFGLLDLVAELERLIAREEYAEAKQRMLRAVGLLRDGYFLRPEGAARFHVEYVSRGRLCSARRSRSEVEQKGVEAVVATLREPRGYKV